MIPRLDSIAMQICIADGILKKHDALSEKEKKSIKIVIDQIGQHLEAIEKYEEERVKNSITDTNLHRLHDKVVKEINTAKESSFIQKHSTLAPTVIGMISSSVAYMASRSGLKLFSNFRIMNLELG